MILITPVLFLLHVKMSAVKKTKKKTLPLWAVPTLKLTLLDVYLILVVFLPMTLQFQVNCVLFKKNFDCYEGIVLILFLLFLSMPFDNHI